MTVEISNHDLATGEVTDTIHNVRDYLAWLGGHNPLAKWLAENGWQMQRATDPPEAMYEQKMCYANSLEVATACDFLYCEGFAASSVGIPLDHAWCLVDEGDDMGALDVTWRHECQDFFGVIIPTDLAHDLVVRNDVYGILPNLWMLDDATEVLDRIAAFNREFREEFDL